MTLEQIATQLVAGCRDGTEIDGLRMLYAQDAVSVEPKDYGNGRITEGLDKIHDKHAWFASAYKVQEQTVTGPFLHGDTTFAVVFQVTANSIETGEQEMIHEVAVYHVADGKIVREEFFSQT